MARNSIKESEIPTIRVTEVPLMDRILLIGPPGIGKTEIIKQLAMKEAEELGKIFVDLREADDEELDDIIAHPEKYYVFYRIPATHIFPEDISMPEKDVKRKLVEHLPLKVLKILSLKYNKDGRKEGIYGCLFIDEITNVERNDQLTMYYSILQEKEAGLEIKISENIKIVGACNPPEWSKVVRELPEPLRGRITLYNVTPPTVDEWVEYMAKNYGDNWFKMIAVYLKYNPDDFIQPPESDWENYPAPRNWTRLALRLHELMKKKVPRHVLEATIIGDVGKKVGIKLWGILTLNIDLEKTVEILKANPGYFNELDINARILLSDFIAKMSIEEMKQLKRFFEWLLENEREFLTFIILLMPKEKKRTFREAFSDLVTILVKEISHYLLL
jgi:MoxR-like ATPase